MQNLRNTKPRETGEQSNILQSIFSSQQQFQFSNITISKQVIKLTNFEPFKLTCLLHQC